MQTATFGNAFTSPTNANEGGRWMQTGAFQAELRLSASPLSDTFAW
jgi:hypothetical protein